jgi:hypothetical protein
MDTDPRDFDGNPVCPDCGVNAHIDTYKYRRAWSAEEATKMPEATCPNRRHETWRLFMSLPAVAR